MNLDLNCPRCGEEDTFADLAEDDAAHANAPGLFTWQQWQCRCCGSWNAWPTEDGTMPAQIAEEHAHNEQARDPYA